MPPYSSSSGGPVIVARKPRRRCGFPSPVGAVVDVVIIGAEAVVVDVDVAERCGGGRNDGASAVGAIATLLSSPASFVEPPPPLVAALLASATPDDDDDDGDDFFLDMNLFHMIWGRNS
jgi:hypothetical protein